MKIIGDEDKSRTLKETVYDHIISSVITMLNKLNLEATKKSEDENVKVFLATLLTFLTYLNTRTLNVDLVQCAWLSSGILHPYIVETPFY